MTQSKAKLGRSTGAGAFTAIFAIIGVTAVMASVQPARAADPQVSEATQDDAINRQAAAPGYAVAPRPGPYASAPRDRRNVTAAAPRKDFQDIK